MNIKTFLIEILDIVYQNVIPFLLGVAFLVFIWNVVRYFIIGSANESDREKARSVMIWSISAFVIIMVFWGIVKMVISSVGLEPGIKAPTPDYMESRGG